MKRTFCLLATMAFFAISSIGYGREKRDLRLEYIQDYVEEAAAKERLEPALLRAVIKVESNFNHKAVSRVGAKGLMQIMPNTAAVMGRKEALKSPKANVMAGAKYLRELINNFDGNLKHALAAYNAGPGAVIKYKGIPPYKETREYVARVLRELKQERVLVAALLKKRSEP